MGIHNNTPTFTWLKIEGTTITHDNKVYMVEDLKTNLEYIYWELDNPYKFKATDIDLGTSGNRFLILRNNRGEGIVVPNDAISVSFDGNSMQMTEDKVFGLVEKVGEHSGKFVTVEKDVNGIKQNVGTWSNKDGTISENIASIKQTSTEIDLSVKDLDKTFNDNKAVNELREKINKSIIDFNAELGIFNGELSGFFKDNIVSTDESTSINTYLSIIDNKTSEIVLNINAAISLANTQGQTTHKNSMINERDGFVTSVSNLKNYMLNAISDNVFTTTDITGIINMFSKCNSKVSSLKNTVDDFIFLGSGGKIIEELARIGIKSNEIVLSVSNTEELLKTNLGIEKNLLQGNVDDFKNENYKLKEMVKEISVDGSVSELEKTQLTSQIAKLDDERVDIIAKYDSLYTNPRISTDIKDLLKVEYDLFNNKCIAANVKIDTVILDGFINDAEKNEIDTLLNESISMVISLQAKMCQAMDNIDKNTVSWNLAQEKLALQQEISDVDSKVGDLNTYVDGTFSNNVLDITERTSIKQNLSTLIREKTDIDTQYSQWYGSVELDGILKTNYQTSYNNYVSKHNSLVNLINGILAKVTLIDNTDRSNLDTAYTLLNTNLSIYAQKTKEVIDYVMNKRDVNLKALLDKDISDVDKKVGDLNGYVDGTFENNILDSSERKSIKQNLENISIQKADVDSFYNIIYNNENLIGTPKTELQTTYNDFVSKYNSLSTVVDGILNKSTLIDNADRTNHDTAINNFKNSIATLTTKFTNAENTISTNISRKMVDDERVLINSDISDVENSVSNITTTLIPALEDNILTESEKQSIDTLLKTLNKEKIDVDNNYNTLYANGGLTGIYKTNLKTSYDDYVAKYNNIITNINNLLIKTDITDEDKTSLNTNFTNLSDSLGVFSKRSTEAFDSVSTYKIDNMQIGTRNLLLNSSYIKDTTNWSLGTNVTRDTVNTLTGVNSIKSIQSGLVADQWRGVKYTKTLTELGLSIGDYISSSVWAKSDLMGEGMGFEIIYLQSDGSTRIRTDSGVGVPTGTGAWSMVKCENKQIPAGTVSICISIWVKRNGTYYFAKPKLEKGTKCTDWTIAHEDLRSEISDVSGAIDDLSGTMNNAFKDGVLSDAEKKVINNNLKMISNEKADVDKQYTSLYANANLVGTPKTNLLNAYNDFVAKYNTLNTTINTLVAKVGIIDSTDRTTLDTAFNNYKTTIGTYSTRVEEAVSSISSKTVDDAKLLLQGNIDDISGSVTTLSNTMNGAFKDGVLSDAEKKAIKQNLQTIGNEKSEVDKQHSTVYANANLLDPAKANLLTAYNNYNTNYTALGVVINNILNKVGLVDSTDQTNLNTAFTNYRTNSGVYSQRLNEAIDSIAGKKSADAEKNSKTYTDSKVTILNDSISLKSSKIELSEALRQGEITKNPIFYDWVDGATHPTGYTTWGSMTPTKETSLIRNGGNGVRFNVTTLGTQAGMNMDTAFIPSVANSKYLYLEVDFMLVSGTLDGTGILVDWTGMSTYRNTIKFSDLIPTPTLNKWHTVRTIVKRPNDLVTGWTGMGGYVMANYSSIGNAVKDIVFDRVSIREATAEEIATVDLDARLNSAEVKITPEAITQTVKSQRSTEIYNVRYVRLWSNGSSVNTSNHWCEIKVITNQGDNLMKNSGVTFTGSDTITYGGGGTESTIRDGIIDSSYTQVSSGLQYLQIYLAGLYKNVDNIIVWQYFADGRVYNDTKVEVSEDAITWYTLFDSAIEGKYISTKNGHSVKVNKSAYSRTGISTFDENGLKIEHSGSDNYTILDNTGLSVLKDGVSLARFGTSSNIPELNSRRVVATEYISAPNIIMKQQSVSLYVDLSSGIDTNLGTSTSKLKTIQEALDRLNKYIDENCAVYIYVSGIGSQEVRINGFLGAGQIIIEFLNNSKLYSNLFDVRECSCRVAIKGSDAWSNSAGQIINTDTGTCMYIRACIYVEIYHVCLYGSGIDGIAVTSAFGSNVYVNDCEIDKFGYAVKAEYKGKISLFNSRGSEIDYLCTGSNFGEIYLQEGWGVVPNYTTESTATSSTFYNLIGGGSGTTKTNGTIYPPTYTPPPKPATTEYTKQWTPTTIYSDETLNNWSDRSELIQGYYGGWSTGRWTGYIKFNDADIRSKLSGATSLSGRIYLQRQDTSHGVSGEAIIKLYGFDGTTITTIDTTTGFTRGEGHWIDLNSAVVGYLKSGAIKYFYVKADTSSQSTYSKYESNVKLELTYTK